MSTAYAPGEWKDFFVATAGASAALLGLLFVAVSINLERILSYDGLPERALETLLLLLGVLIVSICGLMPGQSHVALGLELLAIATVMILVVLRLPVLTTDDTGREVFQWKMTRWALRGIALVPLWLAGLFQLLQIAGALYWLTAGIVFAIISAVSSAWVLLVEIHR